MSAKEQINSIIEQVPEVKNGSVTFNFDANGVVSSFEVDKTVKVIRQKDQKDV